MELGLRERTGVACLTLEQQCKDESVPKFLVYPSEDIQTETYRFARLNFQAEDELKRESIDIVGSTPQWISE